MVRLNYTDNATGVPADEKLNAEFTGDAIADAFHAQEGLETPGYVVKSWIPVLGNGSAAFIIQSLDYDGYFGDYLIAGIAYNLD